MSVLPVDGHLAAPWLVDGANVDAERRRACDRSDERQACGGRKLPIRHAAASWYSSIKPPSTRRRSIRSVGTGIGETPRVSGATRPMPRWGRWS